MKGNMNHFLQAILNGILKNKEEKIPVEENIPATELSSNRLVKEKNEKRIETEQSQKKNSKEDEEFIAKLNILINENMAGEELSIKFLTDKMAMNPFCKRIGYELQGLLRKCFMIRENFKFLDLFLKYE